MILKKLGTEYKLYGEDDSCIATTQESPHKRLSKQNCDEIFGVINIIDLAERNSKHSEEDYIEGFNKAVELNKDKLFTVEDVRKAMSIGLSIGYGRQFEIENKSVEIDSYIQSLQKPTEIEVEIEMESYGYCEGCIKAGIWHCAHADTCGYAETRERQKLDANVCLILKKRII